MLPRPSSSLYVGGLLPEVSEPHLFEIFNQVGPLVSVRVCRDSMTRRSLGYAYVNFQNVTDAERALDTLNYYSIRGKPCRVMWSQRDPSLRKSGVGNIFIKNLDKSIDNKALHDTFSAFGNILSCKVMTDENANSRGFGFVHFETPESAESAIAKVNGMLLKDKKVFVGHHISRRERTSKYDELKKNFTNVFVKNLEESCTDEELREMFASFGNILSAVVMKDESGKSRGFGFVNFQTHEEASEACDGLNEKEVNGKKLFVGRAQKKIERKEELQRKYEQLKQERLSKYQGVNLYIKNLDDTVDDEKLRKEFEVFGTITSAKVAMDGKVSKGFGFVCFSSSEEATKAVTEMNGRMMGSKPIYVGLAQRKEVRRQQLEAQYAHRAQFRMAQQSGVLGPMYPAPPSMFYPMMPPRGQAPFGYQSAAMYGRPRWQGTQPQPDMMNYPAQAAAARSSSRTQPPRNARSTASHPGSRPGGGAPPAGMSPQGVPMGNQPPSGGAPPNSQVPQMAGQPGAPGAGSRKTGNYRYTSNVRNRVDVVSAPPQVQAPDFSHDFSSLSDASPEQQKQMLGERLYPLIFETHGEIAAKVTGMLLDMDNSELIHLLENPSDLEAKVQEALNVLREAGAL